MKKLVTLYMDQEQVLLIHAEAKRRGIYKSEIVRRAVRQYLPKQPKGAIGLNLERETLIGKIRFSELTEPEAHDILVRLREIKEQQADGN